MLLRSIKEFTFGKFLIIQKHKNIRSIKNMLTNLLISVIILINIYILYYTRKTLEDITDILGEKQGVEEVDRNILNFRERISRIRDNELEEIEMFDDVPLYTLENKYHEELSGVEIITEERELQLERK